MKFVILGTTLFAKNCALGLMDAGAKIVAIISMPVDHQPNNSISLKDFSDENNIPYAEFADINSLESLNFILKFEPDFILSTWPKILGKNIIAAAKKYVIGSHPTPLPIARGRHPLHWLICLGIQNTALTLFIVDDKIDNGPILLQRYFSVGGNINIANDNMSRAARGLLKDFFVTVQHNEEYRGQDQAQDNSSYLRKRDAFDVTIDPRMSFSIISRIVNSFCHPYPGAILKISNKDSVKIANVVVINAHDAPSDWGNYEHGYIFSHTLNSITIRIDDAVAILEIYPPGLRAECAAGSKIRPPEFYATKITDA